MHRVPTSRKLAWPLKLKVLMNFLFRVVCLCRGAGRDDKSSITQY
jgi:hypothetical protein